MKLKYFFHVSLVFLLGAMVFSCASFQNVPIRIESDPSGSNVEVNGVHMGQTPATIYLRVSKTWVGLMYSPDGWGYGKENYVVSCNPTKEFRGEYVSQSKVIYPGQSINGATLFFDLNLVPYNPTKKIDINSNITVKENEKKKNVEERLTELKQLLEKELITKAEYEAKKAEILKEQ